MKNFGNRIKALRRKMNLTQEELAERLNVSYQTISKWETGASLPDITLFPLLANFFDVTTDELLRGERIDEKMLTNSDGVVDEPTTEQQSIGVEPQKEKKLNYY